MYRSVPGIFSTPLCTGTYYIYYNSLLDFDVLLPLKLGCLYVQCFRSYGKKRCIPRTWVCDDQEDCDRGEDEDYDLCRRV